MQPINQTPAWQQLARHAKQFNETKITELFQNDSNRFERFSIQAANLLLDFSKNLINEQTLELLFELTKTAQFVNARNQLFSGEKINITEKRAALHTALRQQHNDPIWVDGENIVAKIRQLHQQMQSIEQRLVQGQWLGFKGDKIKHIVNLGTGGSKLGPEMICYALRHQPQKLQCHFVSNLDIHDLHNTLKDLSPQNTVFIVASKTFTTQETLINAQRAKQWLINHGMPEKNLAQHFIAITHDESKAKDFGIQEILPLWDWVGGRFSLWSAIGLPVVLQLGYETFKALLAGSAAMDEHFLTQPFSNNMPVLYALVDIWNINFLGAQTRAVLPYAEDLRYLIPYLQQTEMESNGKCCNLNGDIIDYDTAPVIWGDVGTNGQHAFHQLLLQSKQFIPVDFIAAVNHHQQDPQQKLLFANLIGQSQALMRGRDYDNVLAKLLANNIESEQAKLLASHKMIPGNIPNNIILMPEINAYNLGSLLALYEHKIFTQSVIWQINAFDQWAVELGKNLARTRAKELLDNQTTPHNTDSSTVGLMKYFRQHWR